jgi:ubiquinone/menaquinone biosynthesis C-methylase UbiE
MLLQIIYVLLGVFGALLFVHTVIRIVRYFYKFPIPQAFVNFIDNPVRRRFQPPYETALRHGIEPGMRVLEVGPGNGTYTLGASQRLGGEGQLVAVDIEPKVIERLQKRIRSEGTTNVEARVADVYELPFEDSSFDLIYMIAVINEIPDIPQALKEFFRVLRPSGTLVFSELFSDPDYPLAGKLTKRVESANFRLEKKVGNFFYYTLVFSKTSE